MAVNNQAEDIPVSWQVDDIPVNASLTVPKGDGPFPAVIMVAGSGPTDRNWNTPLIPGTNGSAALLAQALTGAGFITLRYDKRASGPQLQENAMRMAGKISMQGHLQELAGGVQLLAGLKNADPRHIFALTNSEGCIHGLNYQNQASDLPFAGLVLTSAPARAIGVVARGQITAQLAAVPGGEKLLAVYDAAIAAFTAGQPVKVDESLPEGMRMLLLGVTNPFNQPFASQLWTADAVKLLAGVRSPVLIVLGKKDIQVDWQADGAIFDALVKKQANVQIAYVENANHVLKYEPKPKDQINPAEATAAYNTEDARLDPEAVEIIIKWLKAQV